ncbi:MAG TPA: hypothetical protein VMM55_00915, partial [Thermohalobaculum sp.]|nr:hypothetical protein [Thermohalobaculum sp.]
MIRRVLLVAALAAGCAESAAGDDDAERTAAAAGFETGAIAVDSLLDEREVRLANLRQLTFGGQNAEAYFSPDDEQLVFQATPRDGTCDQQYVMNV